MMTTNISQILIYNVNAEADFSKAYALNIYF